MEEDNDYGEISFSELFNSEGDLTSLCELFSEKERPDFMNICPTCEGTGNWNGYTNLTRARCRSCSGTGRVYNR
jgi:hypothetical protein